MADNSSSVKIKLCGMMCRNDIMTANELLPDYIGFIFVSDRKRYVTKEAAADMRRILDPRIRAVGVFIDETPEAVAELCREGIIDSAQLHGSEDDGYISRLRALTDTPIIKAFRIRSSSDAASAARSTADAVLLDAGTGGGRTFDWSLIKGFPRPYFLAGGLDPENVARAISGTSPRPYAVDVSSGIETDGRKDASKMRAFVRAVRECK